MTFTRSKLNPILKPIANYAWENAKVYNPTVYFDGAVYHLYYRAVAKNGNSCIGYAISLDGENFTRHKKPLIKPSFDQEIRGVEDPRITKTDKQFFLTYTAFDGQTARLSLATAQKLNNWRKKGLVFPVWNYQNCEGFNLSWDRVRSKPTSDKDWSKAGAIFPEKIKRLYFMLFGDSDIWLAESIDGKDWHPFPEPFIKPRSKKYFDSVHVEMGPAPLKTDFGWLVLYHGIDHTMTYRLGFLLLDLNDPTKILFRSLKPLFEPKAKYELSSVIDITRDKRPKVIFCCGAVIIDKTLRIYYGAGDKYVCTATADLDGIFGLLPKSLKNTGQ